jgi:hypothetical protein
VCVWSATHALDGSTATARAVRVVADEGSPVLDRPLTNNLRAAWRGSAGRCGGPPRQGRGQRGGSARRDAHTRTRRRWARTRVRQRGDVWQQGTCGSRGRVAAGDVWQQGDVREQGACGGRRVCEGREQQGGRGWSKAGRREGPVAKRGRRWKEGGSLLGAGLGPLCKHG